MKLYGKVRGDAKAGVTQGANHAIETWVQTTEGRVTINLWADGTYRVVKQPVLYYNVLGEAEVVAEGSVSK